MVKLDMYMQNYLNCILSYFSRNIAVVANRPGTKLCMRGLKIVL